jgi:hypothetical protein
MSESIKEAIPKVLKTLWDLENELRGFAQNSVVSVETRQGNTSLMLGVTLTNCYPQWPSGTLRTTPSARLWRRTPGGRYVRRHA